MLKLPASTKNFCAACTAAARKPHGPAGLRSPGHNSRIILAIQAVYTNIIGLALLILLSPVLCLTGLAVFLFSGRGPIIETTECAGFHNIPFRLMSFRTTRTDGSGAARASGP